MAFTWMMTWLTACMEKTVNWETTTSVPDTFFPAATRLVSGGAVLGGYIQGGDLGAIQDQRAAIYFWDGTSAAAVYDGPGWVVSLAADGAAVWAIAATLDPSGADSQYRALRSIDGGHSWADCGGVPGSSIAQVLSVGPDEAWALGMETLLRTTDAGQHWTPVTAGGARNSVSERLAKVGGRVVITGDGVRATADGGRTWLENGVDGSTVYAVDGGTILARHEGALKLGVMESGGPRWRATFPESLRPFRLVVDGQTIRWLALSSGADVGDGVKLYESLDAGQTWTAWRLPAQAKAEAADLGQGGRAVFLDTRRRVHAPPATSN